MTAEELRLQEAEARTKHWRRWGPYLAERQWGTVREDYSANGNAWAYFPFEHAHLRAYRWGEDGLGGISDNHQRLCISFALWNGKDPILKERLFGLSNPQGNRGEDVKELYYYLDATPTHSYLKYLYKYPQQLFPYDQIRKVTAQRSRLDPEYELCDTGVFDEDRYFDVFLEMAKADVDDLYFRLTIVNRADERALLHVIPQIWFRNQWSFNESVGKPRIERRSATQVRLSEEALGEYGAAFSGSPTLVFTDNETNSGELYRLPGSGFYKDAFHRYVIKGEKGAVNGAGFGTKCGAHYVLTLAPRERETILFRVARTGGDAVVVDDEALLVFQQRIDEANEFYDTSCNRNLSEDARLVQRQALAGLIWTKQFYHYVIDTWEKGDPGQPAPPPQRGAIRNGAWGHFFANDILSMPDKWEYPWFAVWDTAFHMIPMAMIDPDFAKRQMELFLREWYMHPSGQIPAYEWDFNDANPPVHAWACWRVYQIDRKLKGQGDLRFLEGVFHKLMLNFTWWVNRKDSANNNIFEGGFLGLDNIGVFDRSKPLAGTLIEQSDATSWMAMFCLQLLRIAVELALYRPVYEDIASKFFEHFLFISNAISDDQGLWDNKDGFYYDLLLTSDGRRMPLKVRSLVGLLPLMAVDTLEQQCINHLPGFKKRMNWFIENRTDLTAGLAPLTRGGMGERKLLAICDEHKLRRILARMLDEEEFLSDFGIRSLSKFHQSQPYVLPLNGMLHRVDYEPAESQTGMFGGNSNWRGPVWFPTNYLLIEALQRFHHYYGDDFKVEFPTRSGHYLSLNEVAAEISRRLSRLFLLGPDGVRPAMAQHKRFRDPEFRDYVLFYEYFHGDNGIGLGASHQTGWTSLVAKLLQQSGE